jgi:hypothetical protein
MSFNRFAGLKIRKLASKLLMEILKHYWQCIYTCVGCNRPDIPYSDEWFVNMRNAVM